jgi:uncharacterized protein YbaA (DUF1428 family)
MAHYVTGFVVAVPKGKKKAYVSMARKVARVWREHGALAVWECWGVDVKPGKLTSFPQAVKLKRGEVVVLSWAVYKSKASHDRVMATAMKDPRLADMMDPKKMPFDGKRMFWGGFKTVVEA